jgi:hypothetical protein
MNLQDTCAGRRSRDGARPVRAPPRTLAGPRAWIARKNKGPSAMTKATGLMLCMLLSIS